MLVGRSSPFGSQTRTRVLLALQALGESFPRELARVLSTPLFGVQKALQGLEKDGLVVARTRGSIRLYVMNSSYFAREPLASYLDRLLTAEPEIDKAVSTLRRRPRRTGRKLRTR